MAIFGAQWASTLVELPTLTFHHAILPLSIFSALHGIRVSMAYRQAIEQAAAQSLRDGKDPQPTRLPWGQALLSVLAMSLGGGFSASMLLGMPPSWLGSNVVVPTYTLSFLLIQYTYLYDILKDMVPPAVLDSVLIVADGSLRALSIAKLGVDGSRMRFAADSHYPGATEPWFAMLFLGMISGSGGGMWGDLLKLKTHKWTLSTPSWASAATYDMKAALLSAFFYAASTSPQFYSLLHNGGSDDVDKEGGFVAHGGMLETPDAKAMTMLVMCTLLLGKRAEETVVQMAKSFQSNATTTAVPPRKSLRSSSTAASKKKHDDEIEEDDDESSYKPLTRRGFDDTTEEEEEEEGEEDEEQEAKKNTRGGGRKKSSTTTTTTTTTSRRSAKSASVEPSSSEVPLIRSTRLRKPTRQEL
ncbi:hypothetical protein KI688_001111 [Linnemannia hyalina]|uniref:Uncharacterized protein n=1 Tax=Linnemannia hyalina TaxID=64524 RepID=A0A9P7Y7C8_9FUNG|nr:hypothetical protein KI688_001111 [Linnemannia hyalina]